MLTLKVSFAIKGLLPKSIKATMKAVVIHEAGGAEVLKLEQRPLPTPQNGQVLIRVKAFGLNRSDMFTRQGHSPNVKFPTYPWH
jgi:NADPH:quinone reductase-like Zn-dependent oxidoreductase